jgi:hypothetical protein
LLASFQQVEQLSVNPHSRFPGLTVDAGNFAARIEPRKHTVQPGDFFLHGDGHSFQMLFVFAPQKQLEARPHRVTTSLIFDSHQNRKGI